MRNIFAFAGCLFVVGLLIAQDRKEVKENRRHGTENFQLFSNISRIKKSDDLEKEQLLQFTNQKWLAEEEVWANYYKNEFTYDKYGNNTSKTYSEISIDRTWETYSKIDYAYSEKGAVTSELESYWYGFEGIWFEDNKVEFTFDENGNLIEKLKTINDYDIGWYNEEKYTYSYDENNNNVEKILVYWSEGEFLNDYRWAYTYNADVNVTSMIKSSWDKDASQWDAYKKQEDTYDQNDNLISTLTSYSDDNGTIWKESYKVDVVFEGSKILSITDKFYDNLTKTWEFGFRSEYSFDAFNNAISETYSNWVEGSWLFHRKFEFVYDISGDQLVYPQEEVSFPNNQEMNNKIIGYAQYRFIEGEWIQRNRGTYDYQTVNIDDRDETATNLSSDNYDSDIDVFPNPVESIFFVNQPIEALAMYSIDGVLIKDFEISDRQSYDVNEVKSGFYVLVIEKASEITTRLVVVK